MWKTKKLLKLSLRQRSRNRIIRREIIISSQQAFGPISSTLPVDPSQVTSSAIGSLLSRAVIFGQEETRRLVPVASVCAECVECPFGRQSKYSVSTKDRFIISKGISKISQWLKIKSSAVCLLLLLSAHNTYLSANEWESEISADAPNAAVVVVIYFGRRGTATKYMNCKIRNCILELWISRVC